MTTRSIGRGSRKPGSDSAPVGQESTQPPQATQSDSSHEPPLPGRDDRREAAPDELERERSLHLVAHPHAAPAGDAEVAVELDVGVRVVAPAAQARAVEMVALDAEQLTGPNELAALGGNLERALRQLGHDQLERVPRRVARDRARRCGSRRPRPRGSRSPATTRPPTETRQTRQAPYGEVRVVVAERRQPPRRRRAPPRAASRLRGTSTGAPVDLDVHRSSPSSPA